MNSQPDQSCFLRTLVAGTRAEHPEIEQLARRIVTAQEKEIGTMTPIKNELSRRHGDRQMEGDHGMHMSDAEIDMMVPHHEGAITMAEEQIAKGENAELRTLAEDIIGSQKREIDQMREWREGWYGSTGGGAYPEAGGHGSGH